MTYYRNTHLNVGNFTIGEITRALDDAAAFFDGPTSESQKQSVMNSLIDAGRKVITPLRQAGFDIEIVRSFSEAAGNHASGRTFDIAPSSRLFEDCYEIAQFLKDTGRCDQIWIEASDDQGNFHVHVTASKTFNPNPELQTILDVEGKNSESGLVWKSTKLKTYKDNTNG